MRNCILGAIEYANAEELEAGFGDRLRSVYADVSALSLPRILGLARKAAHVTEKTCRTWWQKSGPGAVKKRPASQCMKRPASKRSAGSAASSSSAPPVLESITSLKALEELCGDRYRTEISDHGLGLGERDMQTSLRSWGFDASVHSCREWLKRYRLGGGGKDGNVATYVLAKQDLLRWHHVEQLSRTGLQQRYRLVHGVHADASDLERWVKAQKLPSLDNNEETHNAPYGQWLLDRLQNDGASDDLVQELLEKYLVKTTVQRLRAYRVYREQQAGYMTKQQLEVSHWEYLYDQVGRVSQSVCRYVCSVCLGPMCLFF